MSDQPAIPPGQPSGQASVNQKNVGVWYSTGVTPFVPGAAESDTSATGSAFGGLWQINHAPGTDGVLKTKFGLSSGLPAQTAHGGMYPNQATVKLTATGWTTSLTSGLPAGSTTTLPDGTFRLQNLLIYGMIDGLIPTQGFSGHTATISSTAQTLFLDGTDVTGSDYSTTADSGYVWVNGNQCQCMGYTAGSPNQISIKTVPGVAAFTIRSGSKFAQRRYFGDLQNITICNPHAAASGHVRREAHLAAAYTTPATQVADNLNADIAVSTAPTSVSVKNATPAAWTVGDVMYIGGIDAVLVNGITASTATTGHGSIGISWSVGPTSATHTYHSDRGGTQLTKQTKVDLTMQESVTAWPASGSLDFAGGWEVRYESRAGSTFSGCTFISADTNCMGAKAAAGDPVRSLVPACALNDDDQINCGLNAEMIGLTGKNIWLQYPDQGSSNAGLTLNAPFVKLDNVYVENALSDGLRVTGAANNVHLRYSCVKNHPGTNCSRTSQHVDGSQSLAGYNSDGFSMYDYVYNYGPCANATFYFSRQKSGAIGPLFGGVNLIITNCLLACYGKGAFLEAGHDGGLENCWIAQSAVNGIGNGILDKLKTTTTTFLPAGSTSMPVVSVAGFNGVSSAGNALNGDQTVTEGGSLVLTSAATAALKPQKTSSFIGLQGPGSQWAVLLYGTATSSTNTISDIYVMSSSGSLTYSATAVTGITSYGSVALTSGNEPMIFAYASKSSGQLGACIGLNQDIPTGTGIATDEGVMLRAIRSNNKNDDGSSIA